MKNATATLALLLGTACVTVAGRSAAEPPIPTQAQHLAAAHEQWRHSHEAPPPLPWAYVNGNWTWQFRVKDTNTGREMMRAGYDTKLVRVTGSKRLVLFAVVMYPDTPWTDVQINSRMIDCQSKTALVWPPTGIIALPVDRAQLKPGSREAQLQEQEDSMIRAVCSFVDEARLQ